MSLSFDIELKLSFIGQSRVGKTSLINQYIKKKFSTSYILTIGADQVTKIITLENGKKIKINIWDTAGQERFRSVNSIFLKGSNMIIMVYDITNKESFDEMKNFWFNSINDNISNNPIIGIAANKSDLYENEEVDKEEGKKYANDINAIFKETTATSFDSINLLIKEMCEEYWKVHQNEYIDTNNDFIKINGKENEKKKKACCTGGNK